jgi:IclR-like helix-turn-helix domain-containing protein
VSVALTPIAHPEARRALARMYIDLTLAFHATISEANGKPDCDLIFVAVAVMLGHAEGRPMTVSGIARLVRMPHSTVLKRLTTLIASGLVERIDDNYYIEPFHATTVPHLDRFKLILSRAFAALGPLLTEMDN